MDVATFASFAVSSAALSGGSIEATFSYDRKSIDLEVFRRVERRLHANSSWLTIDTKTTDKVCRNDPYDTMPTLVPCNTITKTSITMAGIEPTVCKRWEGCKGDVAVVFCDVAPSTLHGAENASVDAHILCGNASSLNMPSVAWRFFKSFWK